MSFLGHRGSVGQKVSIAGFLDRVGHLGGVPWSTVHLKYYTEYILYYTEYMCTLYTSVNSPHCPRNTVHLRLPGLANMLDLLDLEFQGSPHSGLDDAVNIGRVVARYAAANLAITDTNPIIPGWWPTAPT